jgi:hypothetical protein
VFANVDTDTEPMLAEALAVNTRGAEQLFADSICSFLRGAVPEVPPDVPAPRADRAIPGDPHRGRLTRQPHWFRTSKPPATPRRLSRGARCGWRRSQVDTLAARVVAVPAAAARVVAAPAAVARPPEHESGLRSLRDHPYQIRTTWMPHPGRISSMAGTSTPYGRPGGRGPGRDQEATNPMIIARALINSVAFIGYTLLAGHVSWLP